MASFFQPPGLGDPVVQYCNSPNDNAPNRLVYCNRVVSIQARLQTLLQYFSLILAVVCLAVPVFLWTGSRIRLVVRQWWREGNIMDKTSTLKQTRRMPRSQCSRIEAAVVSSARSFSFISEDCTEDDLSRVHLSADLTIVRLPLFSNSVLKYVSTVNPRPSKNRLLGMILTEGVSAITVPIWANQLSNLVNKEKLFSAIVVRVETTPKTKADVDVINELLWQLNERGVPSMLNFHHDNHLFQHVKFGLLSGIIVDNACILPDGTRRDYFRSQNLREIMERCARERLDRPGFVVGFHDTWKTQPSAAVVCRAAKVAHHFEAILSHGSSQMDSPGSTHIGGMAVSLSGIEYLRKPEISQLQGAWVHQERPVSVGPVPGKSNDKIDHLDVFELRKILDGADMLLAPTSNRNKIQDTRLEKADMALRPPIHSDFEPRMCDFWQYWHGGEGISVSGCIPLTESPTQEQYEAVLKTQTHLRDLKMLQRLEMADIDKVVSRLRQLRKTTKHASLVSSLIEGLVQETVVVYKGLGTGFAVPDAISEFWGVSDYRVADGVVDVFISRNCPSDFSTVLHTWLAHHGISREDRYEEELLLENVVVDSTTGVGVVDLPLSMRAAMSNSTPGEILGLLHRVQMFKLKDPFRGPIEKFCQTILLDDTTRGAWNDATSNGFLSGSVTIPDLLSRRLVKYVNSGSTQLPTLDNLLELYTRLETVINNALFLGDRETLNGLSWLLVRAYKPENSTPVDINTDLLMLMFFCIIRRAALEDVYLEATDHCPVFSQPDQAAVFSELWVLGSQCEQYFCMKPRALGKIIYDRYRRFLKEFPPPSNTAKDVQMGYGKGGLMSVYAKIEPDREELGMKNESSADQGHRNLLNEALRYMHQRIISFGALSIFCLPAILDLLLLTFLGRGLFMTAYMGDQNLIASCYGLLLSLLVSAGVTGWVGSVGNYYLCHYAYHNMIYFHVQRLSGGFMLSLLVGVIGATIFGIKISLASSFTFLAYVMLLSTYLNVLGIMATMHQIGSPLSSGRVVLWRTMPVLLISPILSSFLNGHDLMIYLSVGYVFLLSVLYQYRKLCHEWMNWLDNVPMFNESDVLEWYSARVSKHRLSGSSAEVTDSDGDPQDSTTAAASKDFAIRAFQQSVETYQQGFLRCPESPKNLYEDNDLVQRVGNGLQYTKWLLHTEMGEGSQQTELFSVPWFAQVAEAYKKRRQMVQGLKEHSIFMLYRYARLDIGQNIGLFLIFLMDRWVSIVMSANSPPISVFSDFTSRYAVCFAILYFCCSVMALDVTLEGYWKATFELSNERISSSEEAAAVRTKWERNRRRKYIAALLTLSFRVVFVLGCTTLLLWFFVDKAEVLQLYYLYCVGYSAVVLFQFNRCFTTNAQYHVLSLLASAIIGFSVGCALHGVYKESSPLYLDVIALNASSITAAILTSICVWKDFAISPLTSRVSVDTPELESVTSKGTHGSMARQEQVSSEVLRHLCLDIDVDTEWDHLPSGVRDIIVSRVVGKPVQLSKDFQDWAESRGVNMKAIDQRHNMCLEEDKNKKNNHGERMPDQDSQQAPPRREELSSLQTKLSVFHMAWTTISSIPLAIAKWTALISAGDANVERELSYSLRGRIPVRAILLPILISIWNGCRCMRNLWIYGMLIYRHKYLVEISRLANTGASRTLCRDHIVAEMPRKTVTGFISRSDTNNVRLDILNGNIIQLPEDTKPEQVAVYDSQSRLIGCSTSDKKSWRQSVYHYVQDNKTRMPSSRTTIGDDIRKVYFYDEHGRAIRGSVAFGSTEYSLRYSYSPGSHDVSMAEFRLTQGRKDDILAVYWGVPLHHGDPGVSNWLPSERVNRVERRIGTKAYVTSYEYQHCRDPTTTTTITGNATDPNVIISPPRLFEHEELLQKRPSDVTFHNDDLLFYHKRSDIQRAAMLSERKHSWLSLFRPLAWRYRAKKVQYRPVPTRWLRTELWSSWRKSGKFDAITACWMDEFILRCEPTLRKYWSYRNTGQVIRGREFLNSHITKIVPAMEIDQDISEVCLLPIKSTDLYAMGLGKDANQVTTRPQDCFNETQERISVIFNDVGCWPDAPGGVSNCRRDLVNGHSTIRNHVLAESGNEYGIPRFQVEKNVQSLKLVPLWGLDCRTPNHGLIENLLESQVDNKITNTHTKRDIVDTFIPLLRLFVKGARSKHITRDGIIIYSNVMLDMFKYFEHKDYNKTWQSKEVAAAWVDAWLTTYDDPDITNPDDWFEIQKPSMSDFRSALAIYTSYFFIFSVQTPEDCPQVFQSTHHGISSLFGMLLKYRRGTTFGIWDHAILWRECCLNISPAQSTLPLPVQSMLLAGMHLAMRLAYFHADVVLPCTSVFNPVWEGDLATDGGSLGHVKTFNRKIDPIVNGVSNMDLFQPVAEVRTATPTVVMLSNVQFIKDIRTAILAADVIVNQYGFKDYRLLVYGAQDREPEYAINMAKLIESSGLSNNVFLKGFGKPQEILKDAWLFMNSSLSEGLPLAVAEAALAGVPVVATAVGATSLILTDPDDPSISYGEVVPPNDPTALARAQISMLAMAGPWEKFTGDSGGSFPVPDVLTEKDAEWLLKRMHDKTEARRQLGMLTRQVVLRGFHGERYLREHEQMYWIQWHLAKMRRDSSIVKAVGETRVRWVEGERNQALEAAGVGKTVSRKRLSKGCPKATAAASPK